MSVQFMLGRSGTGKTRRCLDDIREKLKKAPDGPPLIVLVPDQMTFQTEYRLAVTKGLGGMSRAQVFSFSRLTLNVLGTTGGLARQHISNMGRQMLLRKIALHRQSELKIYKRASEHQGFYELLEKIITEMKRYCFTTEGFYQMWTDAVSVEKQPSAVFADKLHDLNLIYKDLEKSLAGKYVDSEDEMRLLAEKIPMTDSLENTEIWVDGFYSFTPQELTVLEALMKKCQRMILTLTLDPMKNTASPDETSLFYPTTRTYQKLQELITKAKIASECPVLLNEPKRFGHHSPLVHLEENLDQMMLESCDENGEVKLSTAVNRRSEVEGAAREVLHLVRDEGMRFRDIAVLVRDLNLYQDFITTLFEDHQIPVFLDQERSMLYHPLIELIRSGLDIIEQNWRYEAVFRCVKTDLLFPINDKNIHSTREKMDRLENYVLSHGISGRLWTDGKPWVYRNYHGLDGLDIPKTDEEKEIEKQINEMRGIIVSPIINLEEHLKKAKNAKDRCKALFLFLEALDIPRKIENWRDQAEDEGLLEEAREHDQVWEAVMELFDQMVEIVGEEAISNSVFAKMIETGLDGMRFSLVPPALDQVLVGSLDRTRSIDVKSVLVLGANAGVLPANPPVEGIFSEEEREWLEDKGIDMAPGSRRRMLEEEFFIYLALTGAKERLWVSYALADEEGKSLQPSILINRLKTIFPLLKENLILAGPEEGEHEAHLSYIARPEQAMAFVLGQARQWKKGYPIDPIWWDVYNWLVKQENWHDYGKRLFGGLFYQNHENPLTKDTSEQLYGETIQTSVSRMERFSACSFSQFASHGLRLKERKVFRLDAPDIGQFLHAALGDLSGYLLSQGRDWATLTDAECKSLVQGIAEYLVPRLQRKILLSSNRYHYIARKLNEVILQSVMVLRDHAKASAFSPVGLELPFGPHRDLPPLTFELAGGRKMEVVGRIDRVDAAQGEQGTLLRVIDYKSSETPLNLAEVYFGLSLQMLTYLDVVLTHAKRLIGRDADPAGVLYFHVHNPMLHESHAPREEEIEKKWRKAFKMNGLLLADEDAVKMMDNTFDSGHSNIIPVGLKKNGEFYSHSSVINRQQFSQIREYLRGMISKIGTDLTNGVIDVSPYKLKDQTPCSFCSFRSFCQFDPSTESDQYRTLRLEKDDVILQKMAQQREEGHANVGIWDKKHPME